MATSLSVQGVQRGIFLIGSGQTRFGELWDKSLRDLAEEAVTSALADAQCIPTDIDAVIVANMLAETSNNQVHLGALVSSLLPHHPPALRVEAACASGSVAVHTACAFLESGRARTVLVLGLEKMTDVSADTIANALMGAADSEEDQPSLLTFPGIFGLIAQRYMHEHGLTRNDLNLVSAAHHERAVKNPSAHFRNRIDPDDVSQSPLIADPLHTLDCSPISDGAAACIVSTKAHQGSVRIAASQLAHDSLSITKRPSITAFSATTTAMERALREAGITREDIRCLELHDCFSIAAIINLEDLGFAERGHGVELYRRVQQHLTINGSGGLKACGHPVGATGVKQIIEIGKQLREEKAQWGLAHNFGGACASCCVTILEHTA